MKNNYFFFQGLYKFIASGLIGQNGENAPKHVAEVLDISIDMKMSKQNVEENSVKGNL